MKLKTFKELGDFLDMAIAKDGIDSKGKNKVFAYETIPYIDTDSRYSEWIAFGNVIDVTRLVKGKKIPWFDSLYVPESMKEK